MAVKVLVKDGKLATYGGKVVEVEATSAVQASDTWLASKADIPTALKNPNALTVKIGDTSVTYDGSAAKTVEIADGSEVSY